ncbi:hypothetical protein AKJ45_01880 [candidate division MSBL1 archaeon SCGC-AAA261F19]|uniref:Ferredoxin n=2 Tax=candidate division MSBL1 TaxID=215777 RepID=A0A133VA51_9EURY|nr:hypothetical protein AKJ43_00985 [candidate division MSBL1 archaeon SCGC-AAA261D19]KXB03316.1 hypothetical protein AKJ45_01880 [candidate division MSBL1 archaeon SCGC-AAA261F19]
MLLVSLRFLEDLKMKVDRDKCISCGACSSVCPSDAIEVPSRGVRVLGVCTNCRLCIKACPMGAMEIE